VVVSGLFSEFVADGAATAAQLEFIGMIVDHLTHQGVIDPALLYESPFKDIAPTGPEGIFGDKKVVQLFAKIDIINESAVA